LLSEQNPWASLSPTAGKFYLTGGMTMTERSFAKRFAVAVAGGLLLSPIAATQGGVADAAEVKVLTSVALSSALNELAPKFEQATGNKLNIGYSLIASGSACWRAKPPT
jgi:ABC-type tungstate transport system permease subunit